MTEAHPHSLLIASDYRVPDPSRVWPLLQSRRSGLAHLGAHHVLVYGSSHDYGRVLVTIGLKNREPVVDLMRSGIFLDWFEAAGVDDIPALFAGELVEKFDLTESGAAPPDAVVTAIASVADVPSLIDKVRLAQDRFMAAGVRKLWMFQAFDDAHEVLILQHLDSEENARRWIEHPDHVAAEWMAGAGVGAYPPLFVGKFLNMMNIEPK